MKVSQVISEINELKPNSLDDFEIIKMIDQLESEIVLEKYKEAEYDDITPDDTGRVLKAPKQFEQIYFEYVSARIDLMNGQIDAYSLTSRQFNDTYNNLVAHITNKNLAAPTGTGRFNSYF